MKKNIIVTGANGFIGSHLVDALSRENQVYALDRYSHKPRFDYNKNIIKVKINLDTNEDLDKILREANDAYVFEFSSGQTPFSSFQNPLSEVQNVKSTLDRLYLYSQFGVKRVIFPSSAGTIYKNDKNATNHREEDSIDPSSPYSLNKYIIEKYLSFFKNKLGLDYIVFRLSSVYGERQNYLKDQGVIGVFIYKLLTEKKVTVFGSQENARDFVYVKDAVNLMTRVFDKEHKHMTYNLGSGKITTIRELLDIIGKIYDGQYDVDIKDNRVSDYPRIGVDIGRVVEEFSYKPEYSIEQGIKLAFEYIKLKTKT